jgi:hypothetical protein
MYVEWVTKDIYMILSKWNDFTNVYEFFDDDDEW